MTGVVIERPAAKEAGALAELIAAAFEPLPVCGWLVPEPAERRRVLAADFEILLEPVLAHGTVHVTADRSAVAVWLRQGTGPAVPPPTDYPARLAAACGAWINRFETLDELFEANHPNDPHHHLAFLAVAPGRQGAGLGSALLRHHHDWLDRSGLPSYLEASSPGSRELYARHGYQTREPFRVPDGTPFWPMWREPVSAGRPATDGRRETSH